MSSEILPPHDALEVLAELYPGNTMSATQALASIIGTAAASGSFVIAAPLALLGDYVLSRYSESIYYADGFIAQPCLADRIRATKVTPREDTFWNGESLVFMNGVQAEDWNEGILQCSYQGDRFTSINREPEYNYIKKLTGKEIYLLAKPEGKRVLKTVRVGPAVKDTCSELVLHNHQNNYQPLQ